VGCTYNYNRLVDRLKLLYPATHTKQSLTATVYCLRTFN